MSPYKTAALCLMSLLWFSACDGHVRSLYLQPSYARKPPWSIASTVIPIPDETDINATISQVARHLDLVPHPNRSEDWISDDGNFIMDVDQTDNGYWVIRLIDWPSFTRSGISIRAEQSIRDLLIVAPSG